MKGDYSARPGTSIPNYPKANYDHIESGYAQANISEDEDKHAERNIAEGLGGIKASYNDIKSVYA